MALIIYEVTSAQQAKDYYAGGIEGSPAPSRQDYYSEGQEVVGVFGGKLGETLGLAGKPVDKATFDRLCDNLHPTLDQSLTQRTNDKRRVCYDFTFSCPKSWSVLHAFASNEVRGEMDRVFREAIDETVRFDIEPDMQARVRAGGADHDITTGNILTASFDHATARPEDGLPPDPHRHQHLLIWNATMTPDGKIKAGQFNNLVRDKVFYETAFYSRLADKCHAIGLEIDRRGGKEWEVRGVPQSLIDLFSKRTARIEAEAKRLGITAEALKGQLGAKTRSKKQKDLTIPELRVGWDAQMTDAQRRALAKVYAQEITGGPQVTPAEAVSFAIAHISENASVFPERELLQVAMMHGLGCVTQEQLVAEMPKQGVLLDDIDGRRYVTTNALQDEERLIVGLAAKGRGLADPVGMPDAMERGTLNDGQWQAVQSLMNSTNLINLVEGPAGAGKTTLLKSYDQAMRLAGENVTYLATTAPAVKVLTKDKFDAHTVAHFLLDERMQKAAAGGHVVIDETSLLGHKDTVRLFDIVKRYDLKVIFMGDPLQHSSVPRGSLMHVLKDHAGIKPYVISEIIRQKDPDYRAAVKLLSTGKTAEGFTALDKLGWVKELGNDVRHEQLATDYVQSLKDGISWKDLLVISPTHAEGGAITDTLRRQLRENGLIGSEDHEFTKLVATNATEAERGLETTYKPGDILVFHQNAKGGIKKGDRITVTDPAEPLPLAEAAKFSIFRPEKINLAVGDIVRYTATVKSVDGKHTLQNGAAHAMAEITDGGNIRLDNGMLMPTSSGFFRHGICETSFGSQGRTVQRAFIGMSAASIPAINQEQMYVSSSRAKQAMTLYTDDKAAILTAMQRSSQKLAALDIAQPKPNPKLPRRKRLERERTRKRRLAFFEHLRAAWPTLGRLFGHSRPAGDIDNPVNQSHAQWHVQKQQGRDSDHGWGL